MSFVFSFYDCDKKRSRIRDQAAFITSRLSLPILKLWRFETMYTLIQAIPMRQLLIEQLPVLFVSLVIAELFYKFGSFTLEAIGFLATWFVVDAIVNTAIRIASQWRQNNTLRKM
jgi:hypothetical protein